MKKILCVVLLAFWQQANAGAKVTFLEVENDLVIFATDATKSHSQPVCVITESSELWSVSLASDAGRAMYSLILTAMAKSDTMSLNVQSADDCGVKTGVERAKKIHLVTQHPLPDAASNGGSRTIGLYKGDGFSRIGTVLQMGDAPNKWYYADSEGVNELLLLENPKPRAMPIYFSQTGCRNTQYVRSEDSIIKNDDLDNGVMYETYGSYGVLTTRSYLDSTGCYDYTFSNSYQSRIRPYIHPICGNKPCVVKED